MALSKKVFWLLKPLALKDPSEFAVPRNLGSLGFGFMMNVFGHPFEDPCLDISVVAANV